MTDTPDTAETLARKIAEPVKFLLPTEEAYLDFVGFVERLIGPAQRLWRDAMVRATGAEAALRERDQEIARLQKALAEAAMEINCAGPVAHRIRVLKREKDDYIDKVTAEHDAARRKLDEAVGLIRELLDLDGDHHYECHYEEAKYVCLCGRFDVEQRAEAFLAPLAPPPESAPEKEKVMSLDGFKQYRRKQIADLRPYIPGEVLMRVSISAPDLEAGSPKPGDMIARNPKNHDDQWLVAAAYFADNFEPVAAPAKEE